MLWRTPWPARQEGFPGKGGLAARRDAVLIGIDRPICDDYPHDSIQQPTATSMVLLAPTGIQLPVWLGKAAYLENVERAGTETG